MQAMLSNSNMPAVSLCESHKLSTICAQMYVTDNARRHELLKPLLRLMQDNRLYKIGGLKDPVKRGSAAYPRSANM